uniref:G_PROTEIN_RECEP_F1_2 domain-containing protein n=1 Tax=Elaeophora elaphi TaxID=1147741 RepID=A0A0R3RZP6_9BILA
MANHSSDSTFKWLSPFNNRNKLAVLCTQDNRELIMERSGVPLLYRLFRHDALCWPEIERYVSSRHTALLWFMQALQYCEVNQVLSWRKIEIQYNRTFQILITRAAFALVCQRTNDIDLYGLMKYADLFRILFEDNNSDRSIICQQMQKTNKDLSQRCLADKPSDKLYLLNKMCLGHSTMRLIKMNTFFQRFARNCHTLHNFSVDVLPKYSSFGEALTNDIYFMNLLSTKITYASSSSNYLISMINSDSRLLEIVLKTRFHLQLFSITAVKLQRQLDEIKICAQQRKEQQFVLDSTENDDNISISNSGNDFIYNNDESDNDKINHCKDKTNLFVHAQTSAKIRNIAWFAEIGLYTETFLLSLVLIITIFDGILPASVAITETLNANLFETNKFTRQMIQETLYSLAQNGSLLGLTNLLVLVLVVINRSMAGKSIRLSRKCVISIFSLVWIFLFITHLLFSSLQLTAIHFIDQMFNTLKARRQDVQCSEISLMLADCNVFGDLCDRISPFHNFGVYLLRGHTLFTLTFLAIALVIFAVTVCYHRNVRRQHNVLSGEIRECKPQRRREKLFNTLLLSICAYFIAIAGQSFVEIAVFWSQDREDAAQWARWFQLARIAAFVDPLFNPLLVTLRIPAMYTKLQWVGRCISSMALLLCCRKRVKKRRSKQKRILASATGISSTSPHTTHSDDFFSKVYFPIMYMQIIICPI